MKKVISFIVFFVTGGWLYACPVCEKQQPRVLRGVTHGAGPENQWDYVIVWAGVIIVLFTIFYSIKWIFRPGEKSGSHIKQTVLNT